MVGMEIGVGVIILVGYWRLDRLKTKVSKVLESIDGSIEANSAYEIITIKPNVLKILLAIIVIEFPALGVAMLMFPFQIIPGGIMGFVALVIFSSILIVLYLMKTIPQFKCTGCGCDMVFDKFGKCRCGLCKLEFTSSVVTRV